jgi:hypothetical protein
MWLYSVEPRKGEEAFSPAPQITLAREVYDHVFPAFTENREIG